MIVVSLPVIGLNSSNIPVRDLWTPVDIAGKQQTTSEIYVCMTTNGDVYYN